MKCTEVMQLKQVSLFDLFLAVAINQRHLFVQFSAKPVLEIIWHSLESSEIQKMFSYHSNLPILAAFQQRHLYQFCKFSFLCNIITNLKFAFNVTTLSLNHEAVVKIPMSRPEIPKLKPEIHNPLTKYVLVKIIYVTMNK